MGRVLNYDWSVVFDSEAVCSLCTRSSIHISFVRRMILSHIHALNTF